MANNLLLEPKGVRNNNPLNLGYVPGQPGLDPVAPTDGRFGRYVTPEDGVSAAVLQLRSYQTRSGLVTPAQMISRWAPPSENDTGTYVRTVAAKSGLQPDQPVDLNNPDQASRLVGAMAQVETGRKLDPSVVQGGVAKALGGVSDDQFLSSTGAAAPGRPPAAKAPTSPGDAAVQSDSDFLAGSGAGAAPPSPPAPAESGAVDDLGRPIPVLPPGEDRSVGNGALGRIVQATGKGAAQAFGDSTPGMSADQIAGLQGAGVITPASGGGTPLQAANDFALRTVAPVVDVAGRGINALLGGYQSGISQAGVEIGQPGLGRDLAALPEAFPFGVDTPRGNALLSPHEGPRAVPAAPANALLSVGLSQEDLPSVMATLRARQPQGGDLDAVMQRLRTAQSDPTGPQPGMGPTPNSVGASATPTSLTAMNPREAAASQATAENYRLANPLTGGPDATIYVPGTKPTLAEVSADPTVSQQHKVTEQAPGNQVAFEARQAQNNEARLQYLDESYGTPTMNNRLIEARDEQAAKDLATAFGNKKATDPQPVADQINDILAGPDGKISAVRSALGKVRANLTDAKGNLETDPEVLYGVRQDVVNMLGKNARSADPTLRDAARQLTAVKDALDATIEQGAPGYQQYLQNYAAASRPIDVNNLLLEARPGLTNGADRMLTFQKFDRFMRDIVSDRQANGTNAAKSIPDETMDRLWNIHADLARKQNLTLGDARGSPTSMMQRAVGAGLSVAAHGAAGYIAPGAGNMLIENTKGVLARRSLAKTTNRLLNPDLGQDRTGP